MSGAKTQERKVKGLEKMWTIEENAGDVSVTQKCKCNTGRNATNKASNSLLNSLFLGFYVAAQPCVGHSASMFLACTSVPLLVD